jgi:transposase
LNETQQREVEILTRLEAEALDVATAAELLGVSARQVRRRRAAFRQEGMAAVLHGNSGRQPVNHTDADLVARILALAGPQGKYHDLNVCHLHELLEQEEHIVIGRSTLDRLLKQAGLRQPTKTPAVVHRRRRLRRPAEGMLVQIDSSPFAWLEERSAQADLLGAIDDATGKLLFLHFRPSEDQVGYLLLLRSIAQHYGLPMSLYHDRHTILRSPKQPTLEEQLAGQTPMSQVQRVMAELGIASIAAQSPQAKGRIERLWGTLQDRLTKELRLAGINDLAPANAFLPAFLDRYNLRFAQPARDPQSAWIPLPSDLDLAYYFATRETRTVRRDHCISFAGQLLQLLPAPNDPSLVGQRVSVHTVPEGDLYVYLDHRHIAHQPVAPAAPPPPVPPPPAAPPTAAAQPTAPPDPPKRTAKQRAWLFGQH